jgi:hypothetical protein
MPEMYRRPNLATAQPQQLLAGALTFVLRSAIGLDTGTAAQGYIGLDGGDTKLLSETLEYVRRTATQILPAIRADDPSAPRAIRRLKPRLLSADDPRCTCYSHRVSRFFV